MERGRFDVVYASATGATEVANMAYMTRLGLWGEGTPFKEFGDFVMEIENGGVGAMEMVARDLKARGPYMARTISYEGVDYRERIHELSPEQLRLYDVAANAWLSVIQKINEAVAHTHAPGRARARAMSQFWAAHQRFFKQLITAIKVPTCIAEIEKALADNASVVISLMTTGEAQQNRMLQNVREHGGQLEDIDWTPREVLDRLIVQVFPIHAYEEYQTKDGKRAVRPVYEKNPDGTDKLDAKGEKIHAIDKVAWDMREKLRDSLSDMALPGNPIDLIIEHFEPKGIGVAELTGRKERIGVDKKTGKKAVLKRKAEGVAQGKTNLAEVAAFQSGDKRIAIISDAASTGISLHASNRAKNKQRRVHIALELKWSADKQLQDFGRTHRSDQASAPEYVLLSVDIGGDKRFSATIARRLASLGALTKGSREAAGAGEIAKYNFESEYGVTGLGMTYAAMVRTDEGKELLADMGVMRRDPRTQKPTGNIDPGDMRNVPRFLNRVLSLPVVKQNQVFEQFVGHFGEAVEAAKRNGTFDEGVSDLRGALAVRLRKSEEIPTSDETAKTYHYAFEVDEPTRPYKFEEARQWQRDHDELHPTQQGASGWFRQKRSGNIVMAAPSGTHTDPASGRTWRMFAVLRPNGNVDRLSGEELQDKYEPVSDQAARAWWNEAYSRVPKVRTRELHLIGGAVLGVWRNIQKTGARGMNVVRVPYGEGQRVVGLEIPNAHVAEVLQALGVGRELTDPRAIFTGVVEQGEQVTLAAGLKLVRTQVHREAAFEVAGVEYGTRGQIETIPGIIRERIDGKLRFFVPTNPETGLPVLEEILKVFPVIRHTTGGPALSVRQTPFAPNASIEEVLRDAEAEHRPDDNYVAINWQARKILTALFLRLGSPARPWDAVTLPPAYARALADLAESAAASGKLAPAIRQALDTGAPVILVEIGPHLENRDEALREERFHRAQLIAGGGALVELTKENTARLILSPGGVRIARLLRAAGYRPEELSYEIAAHAARGPAFWKEAGITPQQARRVLDLYFAAVEREHGKAVADALRQAAPEDFDENGTPLQHPQTDNRSEGAEESRRSLPKNLRQPGQDPGPGDKGPAYSLAPHRLSGVSETLDELQKTFAPQTRSDAAERSALALRAQAARSAQEYLRAEHALAEARAYFSARGLQESLDFINRIEAGERQPADRLQEWADAVRDLLDRTRDAVQGLGTGKLQTFYETYFPHVWKRPDKAGDVFKSIFAKRPIEGPKAFLKKRKYQSFQEGIDAGLEPVSENAIDLVLLKLKEMERYLLAHRFLQEMKGTGLVRYVPILKRKRAPAGWVELPDPIGAIWGPPWVKVKEALDEEMYTGLLRVAEHLGIDHRRVATMRGEKFGYSVREQSTIRTRFADPESVLIHEIGHVLDDRYDLRRLANDPTFKKEMRDLADLRLGATSSPSYQRYVRGGREKAANMVAAYVHARQKFRETAPGLFRWFDRFVAMHPELGELRHLEYGMALHTQRTQYPVGGLILRGHYFMPEAAARVVKNFLAPGLGGKALYQTLRATSNSMLQCALGVSGYHAGFTTFEALTSRLALAFEEAFAGDLAGAAVQAAKIPITPVSNLVQGSRVMRAYLDDTIQDPELRQYVEQLIEAGA